MDALLILHTLTPSSTTPGTRPDDFVIEQLAKIVGISRDVLYFHANRQPPVVKSEADQEHVEAAYRAFRKPLWVKGGRRK